VQASGPYRGRGSRGAAPWVALVLSFGCGGVETKRRPPPTTPPSPLELRLNEVVSQNQGVWVDEAGETDDYVELINVSAETRDLGQYVLQDSSHAVLLPKVSLKPNEIVLLWADGQPDQGTHHLGFKIDAGGETLTLLRDGIVVDRVQVPALAAHHAYQRMPDGSGPWSDCGWATPDRQNGTQCGPPPLPDLPAEEVFASYTWPAPWPARPQPVMLTELALRPAGFVEVLNSSAAAVDLAQYELRLASHAVGQPWPGRSEGTLLAWPTPTLASGQRVAVAVADADLAAIAATPAFEGVVTLWSAADGSATDRKDFSYYPEHASLARVPDPDGAFRFCTNRSPGASNDDCTPLAQRTVGDRLRELATPEDFAALASGRGEVGSAAVEFVLDMAAGDEVTLLNSKDWDIHYCFIREVIQGLPRMDRCDAEQQAEFNRGWYEFSVTEYFQVEGRRYLLGTLVKFAGSNLHTVEFTPGDAISSEQMLHAFHAVLRHVDNPSEWFLRPQDSDQVARMREIEGQAPIVDTNAPFRGVTFQPLVPTVGYGTLRYVDADAIDGADLGPRDILVTNRVPYAIPLLAGLVTEAFQTPLAHVNVLSRGRGTPNMALKDARHDSRLAPLLGKLVRLEVRGSDFLVEEADPAAALAFWDSRRPQGAAAIPRLDTSVRGLVALADRGLDDLPTIGAKAAQLAELGKVDLCAPRAGPGTRIPTNAFAIPFAYSLEHFEKSGAKARLAELRQSAAFQADPAVREQGLALVQSDILTAAVDPELLAAVHERLAANWPKQRVRFRSSSNTEDLPQFNGAGLYTSDGIAADAANDELATAIRTVWASLWRLRAYDEREYYNIEQDAVAMAVLVHEAFSSEKANGVAISRDVLEPSRGDKFYINAQVGEALVTNPAPGVVSDEFTYSPSRSPYIEWQSRSSLNHGVPVLTDDEAYYVACSLAQIHNHFRPLLDPEEKNSWFAMDIEWKLVGPERQIVIKQARPYSFGQEAPSGWCDL
jgi:hypothetical protein